MCLERQHGLNHPQERRNGPSRKRRMAETIRAAAPFRTDWQKERTTQTHSAAAAGESFCGVNSPAGLTKVPFNRPVENGRRPCPAIGKLCKSARFPFEQVNTGNRRVEVAPPQKVVGWRCQNAEASKQCDWRRLLPNACLTTGKRRKSCKRLAPFLWGRKKGESPLNGRHKAADGAGGPVQRPKSFANRRIFL